jgi:hypothetical protein
MKWKYAKHYDKRLRGWNITRDGIVIASRQTREQAERTIIAWINWDIDNKPVLQVQS